MNIFSYILEKFFIKEKANIILLITLSLALSFFYTNIASIVNANIIQAIQKNELAKAYTNFYYFIVVSLIFISIYYVYKNVQNSLLTTLINWVKSEIFNFILLANNENMRNVNFVEFITPITRISTSCNMLFSDVIANMIPTVGFLTVIILYFGYKDLPLGIGFLLGNILIGAYLLFFWKDMADYKHRQEEVLVNTEKYIIDSLNNIDKIIYKGQAKNEIDIYEDKTNYCINYSKGFLAYMTNHTFAMNIIVYIIIILSLFYLIRIYFQKKIPTVTFITFLSMLMMYRDDMSSTIQKLPTNIDFIGRIEYMLSEFDRMIGEKNVDVDKFVKKQNYIENDLSFDTITFKNVSFKYDKSETFIFENYNKELELDGKIIGITGLSGNGKSSFVKLIMRLHTCTSGSVMIDGHDITTIDPYYIRQNITYVNQNSRLFDRKILENIYYGCKDEEKCTENLREILAYPKIKELYRNIDIETAHAGPLGENLSGGQRQVVNIISGLINPTKILVLDEPTNAIDPNLKREILLMLQEFRKYKKCIMIITHDRDVYSLFDETLEM